MKITRDWKIKRDDGTTSIDGRLLRLTNQTEMSYQRRRQADHERRQRRPRLLSWLPRGVRRR
jgi:hypothetical protein